MQDLEYAVMRDGTRIAYHLRKGNAGGGRLVLVHSLAMDHSFWSALSACLPDAEILTYDCRGHGRSGKPAGPYTVESQADDLADLLGVVGWPRAVVAGASMGGCISLAFAARHGDRLAGLGLIDTTAWYGADAPEKWEERGQQGLTKGLASLIDFQTSRWLGDAFRAAHPDVVDNARAIFVANDPRAYLETCRMLGAADLRAQLATINAPTRIVVGSEDYATPLAMAQALHDGIANSTLRVIEGVRHLTPLECPQIVAEELAPLLTAR